MKIIALTFICSALSINSVWAISVTDQKTVESLIVKTIKEKQTVENTGVAISVFNSKEIVFQKGFGYKNRIEKLEVTPHTAFAIGSTTKAFTALGLKFLENQQILKLSDKVITHLPEFKLSIDSIGEQATIEDLLSHRIGLPRHDLLWLLAKFPKEEIFQRLQYLDFPENAEENFRKKFVYNNFFYAVAGKIIEEKTNTTYEKYIQSNIFEKLGMSESFMTVPLHYKDLATPYNLETTLEHNDISAMAPAGSIYSTSADMTKWIQSWMNKKWVGQKDLLQARIPLDNEEPSMNYAYGQGWMSNTGNPNASCFFHNGSIDGFSTIVLFSPELDLGIVILVNQQSPDLGSQLLKEILKHEMTKITINKSFTPATKFSFRLPNVEVYPLIKPVKKSLSPALDLKRYENPGYGLFETYTQEGKSYARYYGHVWELKPIKDEHFNFMIDLKIAGMAFEFPFFIDNRAVYAPFEKSLPPIHFTRE